MDVLLDTSWTLHYLSTNSASYQNLFSDSTVQEHLSRYFDHLPQFLSAQRPQYIDDFNDESEKLGILHHCQYSILSLPSTTASVNLDLRQAGTRRLIHLTLNYRHTTFSFILYTPFLILSKALASHTKHVLHFLSETFTVSIDPLRLPSHLITNSLQTYISTLSALISSEDDDTSTNDGNDEYDTLRTEHRAALLRSAIGTLKLTISFSSPVAPHLRTIDVGVPYDTVHTLDLKASGQKGGGFLHCLSDHIHLQTGLKLPITGAAGGEAEEGRVPENAANARRAESVVSDQSSSLSSSSTDAPLKVSKLTTAAFAIGIEGRLRFAAKAIEHALGREDMVTEADIGLLDGIANEARRLGARGVD